jgi:hypothetical protein
MKGGRVGLSVEEDAMGALEVDMPEVVELFVGGVQEDGADEDSPPNGSSPVRVNEYAGVLGVDCT